MHRAHGIVRSPFARHLVSPRTRWSARGGSFQELVWSSSCLRQAQDGRGLFNSLGFWFIPSVPPRLLTVTFHPQVPCFRRRFPWKPRRLPGSSGAARRPGSPTSSMLSCERREPASTWAVPERSFEISPAVIPLVIAMLNSMVPGREADHLSSLLTWADHRGSDVVLASGVIVNGSTQIAPYPALAWAWRCVQSYKWTAPQHINVLELTTLLFFCALKRFQAACAVNDFSTFSTAKWRPLSPPRDVRLPKPSTVSAAVFAPSCSSPTLSVFLIGQSPAGNSATLDPGSRSLTTMVRRRHLPPSGEHT